MAASALFATGLYVPLAIIGGLLGGRWLDEKFNTNNIWTIIGVVVGVLVAALVCLQMLKPLIDSVKKTDNIKKDKDSR
ncbi:MAG: AtpZ/AtpI family protein [Dehalococcoidales bacterium]|nr:AtpZ/AtpI family protein [Dehalococcoidales bacterium]